MASFFKKKSLKILLDQQEKDLLLVQNQLGDYKRKKAREEEEKNNYIPKAHYILSHLENSWYVPVAQVLVPGIEFLILATKASSQFPRIQPLNAFSLVSAFDYRARLESIDKRGWALVRAYPIAAPGLLEASLGYHTDQYMICALRTLSQWEASKSQSDKEIIQKTINSESFKGENFSYEA